MEIAELEQLVQMVRESSAGELTIRQEGERVTIRKSAHGVSSTVIANDKEEEYDYASQYAELVDEDFGEPGPIVPSTS